MLAVLMAINFADKSLLGLAAVPLMRDLDLSPSEFGLAGSIFFLLYGIAGVAVGFLGNRFSSTRLLMIIALAWSVSMAPLLLAPTLGGLLVSRLLLGAAEGPTAPIAGHAVQKWFTDTRRSVPTAMIFLGSGVGVALAAPLLTPLIDNFGWKSAVWVMAALSLLWAIAWKFIGREGPLDTYSAAAEVINSAESGPEKRLPYRQLFGATSWWAPMLALAPGYFAFAMFSVWGPSYLVTGLGFSSSKMGLLIAVYGAVAAVGFIAFSWLSGNLVNRGYSTRWARGVYIGVVVTVSGLILVASMSIGSGMLAAWLMLIGFGLSNTVYSIGYLLVAEVSPVQQRSAMLATFNSVVTAGAVLAPSLGGLLVDHAGTPAEGYRTAFLFCGLLLIVGGIGAALFTRPDRDRRRLGLPATQQS
ncbi:hypothetical protein BH686_11730 [Rhodococcus erythropolis]|uniref:MFS transporter n=1 Tax=Rhodococcus erythropolis TaxID=1833 RepID=UPI000A0AB12B|nr:MFS transporter [Rhodococcus erythropolis]ORI30982.1 hypothetical protein BH686_11730 [Rhodococcus erythropolis]